MNLLQEGREAWRYRELLGNLIERELQVRYKNSLLGVAWSLANPIVRALILYVVFTYVVQFRVKDYSAYVLVAFFPWTYFLTGVLDAGESVSKQMGLVRKVYFPRELLPIATTIANLRHFFLSLAVLGIYLVGLYATSWFAGSHVLPPVTIFLLPVLIVMQTLLIAGIALFIAALNVFYEDIKFLAAVLLDLLFYGVPIIYFLEQVQTTNAIAPPLRAVVTQMYLLNPMVVILASYRAFLLHPQMAKFPIFTPDGDSVVASFQEISINQGVPWPYFWLAFLVCVVVFLSGYSFFNRRKWRFVEM